MRWWGKLIIFVAGALVGALLCYGYLWYQVYEKFNNVWTCQVFTGKLSVEEAEHCKKWNENQKQTT